MTTSVLAPGAAAARSSNIAIAAGAVVRVGVYQGPIAPPAAATLSNVVSGALGAVTNYVKLTFVGGPGESLPSAEASLACPAGSVVSVASPATTDYRVTGYNVYVSTATGTETKQNATPVPIGTAWQEPASGLIAGAAVPVADTTAGGLPPQLPDLPIDVLNPDGSSWTPTHERITADHPSVVLTAPGTFSVRRPLLGAPIGVCTDP